MGDSISSWFKQCWADIQEAFNGGIAGTGKLLINWSPAGLLYKAFAAALYQEQVAAGQRAEAGYLEQIAQLESRNKQLQGQINDVTQRWIDEKGKSHPIECVFTRGFVRQYNAALGYDNASVDTGHSDSVAATGTRSGTATGQPETTDTRLRDSGVSQRDVLANIIDNAWQCRRWRNQINALLDEREGLQK